MSKTRAASRAKKPAAGMSLEAAEKHFENLSRKQAETIHILNRKLRTAENERDAWSRACLAQGAVIKVQADRILDYEIPF